MSKGWSGGMELQMTQAWRELCELSSGFSELHRGSGTLQQQAGETRGVNGRAVEVLPSSPSQEMFSTAVSRFLPFKLEPLGFSQIVVN
jgi:hypothetical protein